MSKRAVLVLALLAGCGGSGGGGGGTPTAQSQTTEAITVVRSMRLFTAFAQVAVNTIAPEDAKIHDDGNLFYQATQAAKVVTTHFFSDVAGSQPAGSIVVNLSEDTTVPNFQAVYPLTAAGEISVTGGARPSTGHYDITFLDERINADTSGSLTVHAGSGTFGTMGLVFNMHFDRTGNKITGSGTATTGGATLAVSNVVMTAVRSALTVTATVNITPPNVTTTGTLNIDTDDRMPTYQAGTLEMSDGTKAAWDKAGAGTVTLSDGTVVTVANFDKGE